MRARRPQYCSLSNRKLAEAIGWTMPRWEDALSRHVALRSVSAH
jgi:dTDP-4-dehydrorhamnose reductase